MQGSLYYFEGDDSGTVRVNVSAGRAPQAASARAATPPRSTRCFSGQIAIANEWCRVLWWSDPSDDSLHVFTVPTTNIPTQPHSSTPRHIVLTYPAPACGIDVHGIVDHGRLKLTIGWCSPFAELFVSDITVVRDGADNSVSAKYVKSVVAALDVGGAKTATALSFANQGAVDTANAFLVASGSDVWSVLVNERGEANESRLYGAGSNVTAIAVSVLQRRLFVATGSPQVVRVLDLNANAKSIMDITLPGRDVLVRSLVPSPCGQAVFAIGYDTMIKSECVITLLSNGQTKRVSGLGTMTVASVAADAQGPHAAAFSWSQSPPMPRGPLETGADGTPAPTTIHCAALSKQPLLVDLTLTRTAMLVPIAEAQSALLVVSGSSPRSRVVAVTHRVDTVLMPHAVVTAFRTAQASSGRIAGDSGVFTVSSAHVEPAPRDAEPWYNAVEAGGCIANAVAEAPELLRQIIATAIARPHSVAESPAFTRLIRTAHALGQAASIPARVIAAAATHLLLVDQPGGPAAAFANHGVWLASSFRFRASLLAADLHRRLTALIFLHLAALSSSSTCSAAEAQGLEQVTKRALLHVSAAIAVLRAAGHHLEQLRRFSAAEGPIHAQLAALLLPQKPSDFDDDLRVLQLTLQYQTISSVPSAVKAVAAWTATWIVAVPVTRHFAINEIVAKHGGPGASSALVATIRAVSDAIINLNSSIVADVVELLVGSAIAEKQGWVYTLLNTVDGIVQRHRLAALIYRVFVLRELVQEAGSVAALTADHVASLYHDAETLLALVTRDDHGSHDDTFEALADLVLDSTIYLCRDATLKRDFTRALRLLQRMASVPAAAAELYVEENTVSITTTMAEHGAMRELNHALITDTTIAKGIAMCLFELAKEPKTASGDRDSRETRRLQCTSAAVTFLTSRGALGSAAKVAYEVAVGMRSAMTRGPLTLERAHSVMCMALNTLYVIPPYVPRSGAHGGDDEGAWSAGASTQRNWSAETPMQREMTTAFTPESNGIGHLSPADIPELTRRCHQLACEAKLVHTTAVNCAPWSSIESTLAPQNVKAAEDTTKELIRARLWTDALLMADLWHLDADLVLRSWVADLLESPSANGMVDAYDGRWGQILDICGARSTTGNHHHALQLLLSVCLNHAKYRETPEVLKKELLKRDTQAVLSTILSVARLPASLTEEALHIAISYCDLSLRKGNFVVAGLSGGVVSAALLDRLAALARRVRNSDDSAADLDDRRRAALLDACSKYLDIFPKYVERKN